MKKYIQSSNTGLQSAYKNFDVDKYFRYVVGDVKDELEAQLNAITWNLDNDILHVDVKFWNGSSKKFDFSTNTDLYVSGPNMDTDTNIIINRITKYMKDRGIYDSSEDSEWEFVAKKQIRDIDGFMTEYTLWHNVADDSWGCIFGDSQFYTPDTASFDMEFMTEAEARYWFENYELDDEDGVTSSSKLKQVKASESAEFVDMGTGLDYWYFTTHGVQPGSVPHGLEILEVRDTPNGTFFKTNKVITTKALNWYDIKEKSPITAYYDPIEDMDASGAIGPLKKGDKFKNRQGAVITITDPAKGGRIQYCVGDECRIGTEKSIQKMLYRNNYIRM